MHYALSWMLQRFKFLNSGVFSKGTILIIFVMYVFLPQHLGNQGQFCFPFLGLT